MRVSIDSAVPEGAENAALDPRGSRRTPYLKLAPSTPFVSAELTYRDGSVSEIRGSGVEGRAARHLRNAKKPRSMPGL
jgi:hypothetical protein